MAEGTRKRFFTWRYEDKIEAAKVTTSVGCNLIIADGQNRNPINNISKRKATWFLASQSVKAARKNGS